MQHKEIIKQHRPDLSQYEELYKHFHQYPETSHHEQKTASSIAAHLHKLSPTDELDIRTNIGGGLIAICKNGPGPTVLLRADIDGMAVQEKTGLPYASKNTETIEGHKKQVMHACGHDVHLTSLLAATETLISARDSWSGTVVALFQPAEEVATGAKGMIDSGLFKEHGCPVPDVFLAQHVYPEQAGTVQTKIGPFFSAANSYRITIHGRGGHGSMPHKCIDPVVIASHIIIRLQTIVSREVPPDETAVITVGSLQSGHTVNVISDEAVLQVNVRTVTEKGRQYIIKAIKRIVDAECTASRCPKPAEFETLNEYPLTDNDQDIGTKIQASFGEYFGNSHSITDKARLASEDFSVLARAVNKPYFYWTFGGVGIDEWQKREADGSLDEIPVNHSSYFAPAIQPTLMTGIDALVVACLTFVGKQ